MNRLDFNEGILIIGFPRTGTTLLRTLFKNNKNYLVYEIELQWLLDYFLKFGNKGLIVDRAWTFLNSHLKFPSNNRWELINIQKDDFVNYFDVDVPISPQTLFRGVMELVFKDNIDVKEKKVVVKYPALIEHEKLVNVLFEEVIVVNMVRDPRAAISSYMNRWFTRELFYVIKLWTGILCAILYGRMYKWL